MFETNNNIFCFNPIKVNIPNASKDDLDQSWKPWKWTDTTWDSGRVGLPYAYHESVPETVREKIDSWLGATNDGLSCVEFTRVENAMVNAWDHGVLILYETHPKLSSRCFACVGRCEEWNLMDTEMEYNGEKFKPRTDEKMKETWQFIHLSRTCTRRSTVLHEFMHSLGYSHEQNHKNRDDYVFVDQSVLKTVGGKTLSSQFDILNDKTMSQSPWQFELDSVMMYGPYVYDKNCDAFGRSSIDGMLNETTIDITTSSSCSKLEHGIDGKIGMSYRVSSIVPVNILTTYFAFHYMLSIIWYYM